MFSAFQGSAFWSGQYQVKRPAVIAPTTFDDTFGGGMGDTRRRAAQNMLRERIARDDKDVMEIIINAVMGGIL